MRLIYQHSGNSVILQDTLRISHVTHVIGRQNRIPYLDEFASASRCIARRSNSFSRPLSMKTTSWRAGAGSVPQQFSF